MKKRKTKKVVRTKKPKLPDWEGMAWFKNRIEMIERHVDYLTQLVNSRALREQDTHSINDLALGLSEVRERLESLERKAK
jgi:hypothetical protein